VIGGLAGFMGGGPAGAAWGCIGAFDATMAAQMAKQALETPPPPPPPPTPDDDWGGVCEPPVDEPNMSGGPGGGDPGGDDPGTDQGGGLDGDPGDGSFGGGGCFVAGTAVATLRGAIAIEQLVASEQVWAGDPENHVPAPRALRRVIPHQSQRILSLDFGDETIRCTPPHPFFAGTWTLAGDLQPGDRVLRRDGGWQTLRAVESETLSVPVFDLAVRDLHTFYVGASELLVHNKDKVEVSEPWDEPGGDDPD